ncbi:MAG: DNA repair protein RadC [Alphaproteobacteria bacterium]|nr:DNA repair protein RadC [Alphaproteobacteria bacterium]
MTANNDDKLFRLGHRDRLRQKFLDGKLTDAELLELLLADVIPRRDVRVLSRSLIQRFGSVSQVFSAPIDSLEQVNGIGHNTAVHLKLINELLVRGYKTRMLEQVVFRDDRVIKNYCLTLLSGKSVEEMHVLYLDKELRMLQDETHSVGTIDWAPVFNREIIKKALNLNARSVALLHNHPGGGLFSTDDVTMTTDLETALNVLNIDLYDHYLVSNGVLYSMCNENLLIKKP